MEKIMFSLCCLALAVILAGSFAQAETSEPVFVKEGFQFQVQGCKIDPSSPSDSFDKTGKSGNIKIPKDSRLIVKHDEKLNKWVGTILAENGLKLTCDMKLVQY